jgi:hypothetical protein
MATNCISRNNAFRTLPRVFSFIAGCSVFVVTAHSVFYALPRFLWFADGRFLLAAQSCFRTAVWALSQIAATQNNMPWCEPHFAGVPVRNRQKIALGDVRWGGREP